MVVRDGCEGWWEAILLYKIFKKNSYFFPIFSGKFLFFSYFLGAQIPIFLFFWSFLLLDALPATMSRFFSIQMIDSYVEKFGYEEQPQTTSSFFDVFLLLVSGSQCTIYNVWCEKVSHC